MSSLDTLVAERSWYVFHTHTHKDAEHAQGPID